MNLLLRRRAMMARMNDAYIQFSDPEVERICIANFSGDGVGVSLRDAAAVSSIGTAFQGNTDIVSFDELAFFTNLATIPSLAFNGCSNLTSIVLPESITSIGNLAFQNCSKLEIADLHLPHLTSIGTTAFKGVKVVAVSSLGTVTTLPNQSVFENCTSLTSVVLPDTLTYIGTAAFNRDTALASINIPAGVTSISNNGFWGCTSLQTIDLPSTITNIGGAAFAHCSGLVSMYIRATTPPSIGYNAFQNCTPTFYVPAGSVSAYEAVLPSGCTIVGF